MASSDLDCAECVSERRTTQSAIAERSKLTVAEKGLKDVGEQLAKAGEAARLQTCRRAAQVLIDAGETARGQEGPGVLTAPAGPTP